MRFIQGPSFDELVMDIEVQGFLKKYEEADYHLYKQERDQWVWVDRVRSFGGTIRVRAVRREAQIETEFEPGDRLRTKDSITLQGKVGFSYRTLNPDSVLRRSKDLTSLLNHQLLNILDQQVCQYQADELRKHKEEIVKQVNKELRRRSSYLGIELIISHLLLDTQIDQFKEKFLVDRIAQQMHLALDAIARRHELVLSSEEHRQRIDDQVYQILQLGQADVQIQSLNRRALTDDQVYNFTQLLPTQHAQLQLDVDRVVQMGQADAQVQRMMIDNMQYQLENIFGNLRPDQVPAAIAIVNPDAGRALAEMMGTQALMNLEVLRTELLSRYLITKSGNQEMPLVTGGTTFGSKAPYHTLPTPNSSPRLEDSDPVVRNIRHNFPDVKDIVPKSRNNKRSYLVEFDDFAVKFEINDGKISGVHYGTGTPETRLGSAEKIPTGKPVETLAVELVQLILEKMRHE